ncbi:hypothetical protein CDD82_7276 [Ophiocordyceps australis]|uniref:Tim44-like domain-containing protein n=1 Tax=Ophiocordyceps australis TaxID=1399860 RepID=A0A2C5ZQC3_9HYPO|nr:hypothetical protein CDD82_7276 [Ophiocordyceps australis]
MASVPALRLRTGRLGTSTLPWNRSHGSARPTWCAAYSQARFPSPGARMKKTMPRPPTVSQMKDKNGPEKLFQHCDIPLLPVTFVAPPLSQQPRSPRDFVRYQWWRLRLWLSDLATIVQFKMDSAPKRSLSFRWKARRRDIAPTANIMYRSLLEAFAAGDRATIQRLCTPSCAAHFTSALECRNPRQYTHFSVVAYNKPLFYPRLASHKIHNSTDFNPDGVVEQAVVAICSTQMTERRLYSTDAPVPGTLRTQEKIEYVVLTRFINIKTLQPDDWRIWGTTKATQLQDLVQELKLYDALQRERYASYLVKKEANK